MHFTKIQTIIFITIGIISTLSECTVDKVQHGNTYTVHNENDKSFLTAAPHRYRRDYGIYPGKCVTNEYIGYPNQLWDLIRIPGPTERYWMLARTAVLNTVSTIINTESPMPEKNFLEFIPVNITLYNKDDLTEDNTKRTQVFATVFLIKSVALNTCIQSQGQENEISYAKCNMENRAQRWFLDYHVEDNQVEEVELARNKLKFYCKFHG